MDLVAVDGGGFASGSITPSVPPTPAVLGSAPSGDYWTWAKKVWLVGKFVGFTYDGGDEAVIYDM